MKQKKWKDCPACGAKDSMRLKKFRSRSFGFKSFPAIKIGPISEYVCGKCGDGIYTIKSGNLIEARLTEYRARCEAKTTVVADVLNVVDASRMLHMTRQGVINLMKRGKLPYVFFGRMRIPKRESVIKYSLARH